MNDMRVLVANEPNVYREAIAEALRELRPHVEVSTAEPGDLDREIGRLEPHLVVCSRISTAVEAVRAWVLLYPDGENRAEIKAADSRVTVEDMKLGDLISAMDGMEHRVRDEPCVKGSQQRSG
jgi:hypothetical protein